MSIHIPSVIEKVPIDSLIPYAKNARTHSEDQIDQIANSMREFGWTSPVLVDADGGIIAGHGRLLAAKKVGLSQVPVIRLAHLTEAQRRALVLADNKLALNARWDNQLLAEEIRMLDSEQFDLSVIGFSLDEIENLTVEPDFAPGTESDQGQLDEKKKTICPGCGHEFTP